MEDLTRSPIRNGSHFALAVIFFIVYTMYIQEVSIMLATISKWGNGHGIRLSRRLMAEAHLSAADQLDVVVNADKSILLRRVPKTKADRFLELFGSYQGDLKCSEAETGKDVGNEVLE